MSITTITAPLPATTLVSVSAGSINTTSETFITATSMTITPIAGTYKVSFLAETGNTDAGNGVELAIAVDGTEVTESEMPHQIVTDGGFISFPVSTFARVIVDGTEEIQGRWSRRGGAGTAVLRERQLFIMKVA